MNTIDRISRMLKEEKGVTCKPNWLAACIEWAIEEERMVIILILSISTSLRMHSV